MKRMFTYLAATGLTVSGALFLPASSFGQAYVGQANQGSPRGAVYLEQVPLDAKPPRATGKPQRKAPLQDPSAAQAAVVTDKSAPFDKPRYPDVAAGSSAIVRVDAAEWPTVGRGAVNQ